MVSRFPGQASRHVHRIVQDTHNQNTGFIKQINDQVASMVVNSHRRVELVPLDGKPGVLCQELECFIQVRQVLTALLAAQSLFGVVADVPDIVLGFLRNAVRRHQLRSSSL